jgi:type IV secretory pathway TrbL component
MEKKEIEKMTGDLLKKSLLKIESPNFDDELMQKILEQPKPVVIQSSAKLFKNGWRFLILSFALLLLTIAVISYLTTGYSTDIEKFLMAIKMYVLYGGLALFVPLIFTQMDTLLEIFFQSRFKTNVNY